MIDVDCSPHGRVSVACVMACWPKVDWMRARADINDVEMPMATAKGLSGDSV